MLINVEENLLDQSRSSTFIDNEMNDFLDKILKQILIY